MAMDRLQLALEIVKAFPVVCPTNRALWALREEAMKVLHQHLQPPKAADPAVSPTG